MAALLDDSCMGQMQRSHSLDSFLAATQLTQLKQVKAIIELMPRSLTKPEIKSE